MSSSRRLVAILLVLAMGGISVGAIAAGEDRLPHSFGTVAPAATQDADPVKLSTQPTAFEEADTDVPSYSLSLTADGTMLVVAGGVRFGIDRDIAAVLDKTPTISTIALTSPGGRLGAAEQVALMIRERGLDTYVPQSCLSACTRIFVAGRHRTLLDGARLGFHGAAFTTDVPAPGLMSWLANEVSVMQYTTDGVDRAFMQRAVSIQPAEMWFPTVKELYAAHVITAVAATPAQAIGNLSGPATLALADIPPAAPPAPIAP
ncbi:MAG: hypothetical protein ACTHOR_14410 [Devosia sp.]|nr:hypothetical protein [Devosiaceae bacterium]